MMHHVSKYLPDRNLASAEEDNLNPTASVDSLNSIGRFWHPSVNSKRRERASGLGPGVHSSDKITVDT